MKIRCGFVTNSSSSSFLIRMVNGKPSNIDELFNDIKQLYKDMFDKTKQVVVEAVAWGIAKEGTTSKELYEIMNKHYWESDSNKYSAFDAEIDRKYGVSWFSLLGYSEDDFPWLNCNTYNEYVKSFDNKGDMPFIIIDHKARAKGELENSSVSEAVYWYKYDEIKEKLSNVKTRHEEMEIIWKYMLELGDFGVYSTCGKIPELVVMDLYDISEYGCNHMG